MINLINTLDFLNINGYNIIKAWNKMMDLLDDDDDVQEVYHNYEEE